MIDTAKAVASVSGAEVAAIPTTLSGAEMTGIHRIPAGAEDRVDGLVRPSLVIADPEAMTGAARAAAAGERDERPRARGRLALHALRQPGLADDRAARRRADRRPRSTRSARAATAAALALGAILCGYAIDSGMFAIHHVICQTLVRVCGSPHAETNAGDPAAGDGVHGRRAPRTRSPRWRRRSAPSPTAIEDAHPRARRRSARARRRSAPTASGSTRPSTRSSSGPSSASRRARPSREELTALIERAW